MRLRALVTTRAVARTSKAIPSCGLPLRSKASAWNLICLPLESQSSVLMPANTAAGHKVRVLRRVCTSPLGSE